MSIFNPMSWHKHQWLEGRREVEMGEFCSINFHGLDVYFDDHALIESYRTCRVCNKTEFKSHKLIPRAIADKVFESLEANK